MFIKSYYIDASPNFYRVEVLRKRAMNSVQREIHFNYHRTMSNKIIFTNNTFYLQLHQSILTFIMLIVRYKVQ